MEDGYTPVVVESFYHTGGGSAHAVRCRPVEGQGLPTTMYVECSSKMRKIHPVGTRFRITAKVTDKDGGTPFLYTSHLWPYVVVP